MPEDNIRSLNEYESGRLLKEAGLPVIEGVLAHAPSELKDAASGLEFPLALKVCSEEVPHKSEHAGVVLDIRDSASLQAAACAMQARFSQVPHALLVQPMAAPGLELILGARQDPVFGPVVLVGMGGELAEVLSDTVIELAPLNAAMARSMLERLRGYALLRGFRSQPGVDLGAVVTCLVRLARLIHKRRDILEIDLNPLVAYPQGAVAVDALVRLTGAGGPPGKARPDPITLECFFNPRSLALIGASGRPGKGGNIILRNLLKAGFKGRIHPVNPTAREILGLKACRTVREVQGVVDLAMIVIPKDSVEAALSDCVAKGVGGIILATGGYADIGEAGERQQQALMDKARQAGIRIMGPNSIGVLNPDVGLSTSIVGLEPIPQGGVSLIGQSGVIASGWARWIAERRPFGLAKVACIGNKGDIDESDLLNYLAADDKTTAIGMYLEGVSCGEGFIDACMRSSARKPVVVVKSGRSAAGQAAIASHTGSLAGSDAVFDAVCRRTGLLRVHDAVALFEVLSAFETLPLPRGRGLGVLSITGMGCVVATDAAWEYGIELPALSESTLARLREVMPAWAPVRNPVDIWSAVEQHGSQATMRHIAQCLIDQPDIDALLIVFVLMPESIFDLQEAFGGIVGSHPEKPVFVSSYGGTTREVRHLQEGFSALGVPCYPAPERAVYAFRRMVDYARYRGLIPGRQKAARPEQRGGLAGDR